MTRVAFIFYAFISISLLISLGMAQSIPWAYTIVGIVVAILVLAIHHFIAPDEDPYAYYDYESSDV